MPLSLDIDWHSAQLDEDPYYVTVARIWGDEPCSLISQRGIIIQQVKAPSGYQLDATPRTYQCTDATGWQGLADGDIHYIMQPIAKESPTPVAPTPTTNQVAPSATGITIPAVTGIEYLIDNAVLAAGFHNLAPGAYIITVRSLDGYILPSSAVTTWTLIVPSPAPRLASTGSSFLGTELCATLLTLGGILLTRYKLFDEAG